MNNTNPILNTLQQGFRITVGATASLVETLQDPQKRQMTAQELQQQWGQRAEAWAEKGSVTESEARRYVDQLLTQIQQANPATGNSPASQAETIDFSTARSELEELTEEIMSVKETLAQEKDDVNY